MKLNYFKIKLKNLIKENLDTNITNDDVKSYFEKFGKVSYISLPKYRTTNQLKGFGFIEFLNKEDAKKAVEVFIEIL